MTPERLAAIKARLEKANNNAQERDRFYAWAYHDIPDLVAEVERFQALLNRARNGLSYMIHGDEEGVPWPGDDLREMAEEILEDLSPKEAKP